LIRFASKTEEINVAQAQIARRTTDSATPDLSSSAQDHSLGTA